MSHVHPMWLATPAVACLALAASALSPHAAGGKPVVLPAPVAGAVSATLQADARTRYARLPLAFERNVGQTDARVKFFARGAGYGLFLTPTEAVFNLHQVADRDAIDGGRSDVVRMRLAGANAKARIEAARPQAGRSHYIQGNDAGQWRRDVERFEQVRYSGVYDGVDLVYYGNQTELEYDFVVAPGANPAQIGLDFLGPKNLRVDPAGNLVLATAVGDLVQRKPVAYQEIDGERRPVEARYRLDGDRVTFAVGNYDRAHALVIDPVLAYSTMMGGSGDEFASSIAVDSVGNMYVTGTTTSTNFPTGTPQQAANAGQNDVFVTKFNPSGAALVYSTYLGGTGSEIAYGLAVDGAGSVYLTGVTLSNNFPTRTPVQGTLQGTRNMFVTKLAANGSGVVYSTYLGAKSEIGLRIAVDSTGAAVVAGYGNGTLTWPQGAYQPTFGGGEDPDGILFKLNPAGNALVWGTYLGGALEDSLEDVKLDAAGNVYFAGHGKSPTLPVRNAFQATHGGNVDAVFGKFSAAGQAQFVSFFGGTNSEGATGVAVDRNGAIYLAGHGYANSVPVKAPLQQGNAGNWDAFVSKFNATGSALVYSTYFGGANNEEVAALAVNGHGHAIVVGRTDSTNFPSASPFQADHKGGGADGFISVINSAGNDFVWSSLVGGAADDNLLGVAVSADHTVYVAGRTYGGFPTKNPYQGTAKGNRDAVVLRVGGATPHSARHTRLDLNDDARADLLWRNAGTGQHLLWRGATATLLGQVVTRPAPWTIAAIGDFSGDHRGDLFWRNTTTGANEIWRSGRASALLGVAAQVNPAWAVQGAGDFNGDGRDDVVWRNTTTGANELWLSGSASQRQALATFADQNWKVAGIGDFNGDHRADLLWRNSATGANELWLSGLQSQRQVLTTAETAWTVGGVGDINADGKADIIWRNGTTGANLAWLGGITAQTLTATTDMNWKIVGVADYSGDGKADVLWRNSSTGDNVIWNSANSATLRNLPAVIDQAWVPVSR